MKYVYHIKPKELYGNKLLPLGKLPSKLQNQYRGKYIGGEEVTKQYIPQLHCSWSDVIHLSPLDLSIVKDTIEQIFDVRYGFEYYRIPVDELAKNSTVIYLNQKTIHNSKDKSNLKNDYISLEKFKHTNVIPAKTIKYYKDVKKNNQRPLLFYGIAHVLYKGEINIDRAKILS